MLRRSAAMYVDCLTSCHVDWTGRGEQGPLTSASHSHSQALLEATSLAAHPVSILDVTGRLGCALEIGLSILCASNKETLEGTRARPGPVSQRLS